MDGQNSCVNCLFYRQYYVKRKKDFSPIDFGHCTKLRGLQKKAHNYFCNRFESIEKINEQRKESITGTLYKMAQQINDMAIVLKNDAK